MHWVIKDSPKLRDMCWAYWQQHLPEKADTKQSSKFDEKNKFCPFVSFPSYTFSLHNFSEKQWLYSSFNDFFTKIISIAFGTMPADSTAEKKTKTKSLLLIHYLFHERKYLPFQSQHRHCFPWSTMPYLASRQRLALYPEVPKFTS